MLSASRTRVLALAGLIVACGPSPGTGDDAASGGASSSGGTTGDGGAAATGGAPDASSGGSAPLEGGGSGGQAPSGGAGSGGTPAAGGSTGSDTCPTELFGWASQAGDNVPTTTGGGDLEPVVPTTLEELEEYASDDQPRVIHLEGAWDLNGRLNVASNKTIVGIGPDAELRGGVRIRGYADAFVENVILQNLTVNGATTDVDGDAMQVYFAHHVWIDHCEIYDGVDGNLDVTHGSNWVTISWTKFRYTSAAPDPEHKFSSLIGHSDSNAGEDDGRLKVTLHHNWWAEGIIERMPRVRFGQVHSFSNYFTSEGNNYCIRAGRNAHILSEGNFFDGVNSPHEFNGTEDEPTAHITARDNGYAGTPEDDGVSGGGTPFDDPPYEYELDPADEVPTLVEGCVGPR